MARCWIVPTVMALLGSLAACADSSPRVPVTRAEVLAGSRSATPSPDIAPVGALGPDGGTLSRLLFACVGDTRPPSVNAVADYPADVVTRLYADIEGLEPRPPFVISTGDYMFASDRAAGQAAAQLGLYMKARAGYSGLFFPAMGNHECTGATISNCAPNPTPNYLEFVARMLAPIEKALPYYVIGLDSVDGTWTAKVVFVAANAWSSSQQSWLEATLSLRTTYTFVVRHEPASEGDAPGVSPSEAIMARHPYTLAIVGHDHTYGHYPDHPREVLIGNGGAPLSSKDFGYGLFAQRADGAIVVDMVHWLTGQRDPAFHFVVAADGSPM
jgi:hypothetical protein